MPTNSKTRGRGVKQAETWDSDPLVVQYIFGTFVYIYFSLCLTKVPLLFMQIRISHLSYLVSDISLTWSYLASGLGQYQDPSASYLFIYLFI